MSSAVERNGVGPVAGRTRMPCMWWGSEELGLPTGYWVEHDTDSLVLRRPDGGVVAAFSTMGVDPVACQGGGEGCT